MATPSAVIAKKGLLSRLFKAFEKADIPEAPSAGRYAVSPLLHGTRTRKIADKTLKQLVDELDQRGFRNFEFVGEGMEAIVLGTSDNQVLRIFKPGYKDIYTRHQHPAILQAVETFEIQAGKEKLLVEVLPKVDMKVSLRETEMVDEALKASNIVTHDIHKGVNVGAMIVDGKRVPVLVDPGIAFVYDNNPVISAGAHLKPWLDDSGRWLQHVHDPRLVTGQASGVISRQSADSAEQALRGKRSFVSRVLGTDKRRESQIATAINEDGMDRRQVADMVSRALENFDETAAGKHRSFSDALREARLSQKGLKGSRE